MQVVPDLTGDVRHDLQVEPGSCQQPDSLPLIFTSPIQIEYLDMDFDRIHTIEIKNEKEYGEIAEIICGKFDLNISDLINWFNIECRGLLIKVSDDSGVLYEDPLDRHLMTKLSFSGYNVFWQILPLHFRSKPRTYHYFYSPAKLNKLRKEIREKVNPACGVVPDLNDVIQMFSQVEGNTVIRITDGNGVVLYEEP